MINKIIRYFLENRVITILLLTLVVVWGISTAPFNWHGGLCRETRFLWMLSPISVTTSRLWLRNGWDVRLRTSKIKLPIR